MSWDPTPGEDEGNVRDRRARLERSVMVAAGNAIGPGSRRGRCGHAITKW